MSFVYEDRVSDSPFVETIWHTWTESDGSYTAAADGSWDILISKRDCSTDVMLGGPTTKATFVPYISDAEYLGIRFKLGTFMPHLPTNHRVNAGMMLPEASGKSFWLGGSAWWLPDYENVDSFIDRLVRADLLA